VRTGEVWDKLDLCTLVLTNFVCMGSFCYLDVKHNAEADRGSHYTALCGQHDAAVATCRPDAERLRFNGEICLDVLCHHA
jgi:hypothetical protein